jgi:phosphoglycerate kinase
MMGWKTLDDMALAGKTVLCRVDINVPMEGGRVTDTTRIDKIAPTVEDIIARGGKVVLLAHFDRPKGKVVPEMSLGHVAALAASLGRKEVWPDHRDADWAIAARRAMVLLENTASMPGKNDPALAAEMAALGDVRQ